MNPNNPNQGGCDEPDIHKHVTKNVSVTSPDHAPTNKALGGSKFLEGSPKGREANPKPQAKGWGDVRIAG